MAKQNEALFEESSQGAVSAVTAIVFLISAVLVFGGMVLGGYAFDAASGNLMMFAGSLASMSLGFILPFWILPAIGK